MALVKCPECGRERVSDSAEACPDCGYGIKAHFEKIKQEEEERRKKEELHKLEEKRRKEREQLEEERAKEEKAMLDSMPAPTKPFPWQPLIGVFWGAMAILMFCCDSFFMGLVMSFFAFIFIVGGYSNYQDKKRIYEISLQDMERAKREALALERINQAIAAKQNAKIMNAVNPFKEIKNGVRCPMCGKNAGKEISTINRAISVAAVGLASGKIGKQYKCSSCGYMW